MTRSTHYAMNTDGVYTCLACDSPESMYHKNTCVYYRNPIEESRNRIDGVREYPNAISQLTKSMRYDTIVPMEG